MAIGCHMSHENSWPQVTVPLAVAGTLLSLILNTQIKIEKSKVYKGSL